MQGSELNGLELCKSAKWNGQNPRRHRTQSYEESVPVHRFVCEPKLTKLTHDKRYGERSVNSHPHRFGGWQLKGVFALMAKDFHRTDEGLLQARVQRKLTTPTLRGDDANRVREQRAE
jgi:hypothetical protein